MTQSPINEAINHLQSSYIEYMNSLQTVLDFGEANIEHLVEALNHKHANPIAKALGLMMDTPSAWKAIPGLLRWLVTQSPLYPDVLEALVRAGDKPAKEVLCLIKEYAEKGDDEAVRHFFDLACRFSNRVQPQVVDVALELLGHPSPHIRETAADAIWRIGLPNGLPGKPVLQWLSRNDQYVNVRKAACEALEKLGVCLQPVD